MLITYISCPGNKFEPAPTARAKYSSKGGFSASSFSKLGLAPSIVIPLMNAANFSLAATSWTSYATAERHIVRVEKATGVKLTFPFSLKSTMTYVSHLLCSKSEGGRGLQGKTVEKYISHLRMTHMQKGFFSAWIRPEIIKQITRGACNRDQLEKRMLGKTGKHAMTPDLMWILKSKLGLFAWRRSRKRIVWAVSTLCWAGALRIHEVLARSSSCYDPLTTMMASDVKLCKTKVNTKMVETLKVLIRHPKEERLSSGVVIDVFATGDFMCPIKAYKDWQKDKVVKLSTQKPLFRLAEGQNFTGALFNKDLKLLLKDEVDYEKTPITSHSFRRGLANRGLSRSFPSITKELFVLRNKICF